jgi:hypothetical protein
VIRGQAKIGVAVVGMLTAVAGVMIGNRIVVWVAIGILGVAMVLRFIKSAAPPDASE